METKHIEKWIIELQNPLMSQDKAREIKERLSMVNVKDYYKACENVGIKPFTN